MHPASSLARVAEIERQLADWKARLPAHSLSPGLMAELDALEEALAEAHRQMAEEQRRATTPPSRGPTISNPTLTE
jgi:hypothetical protein